jgi:hypothetical protein
MLFLIGYEDIDMRKGLVFFALSCSLIALQARAQSSAPFPRLGGDLIGTPQNYQDPVYQAQIARLNFVILGAWPGWVGSGSTPSSLQQVAQQIKALNPNIQIFNYDILESFGVGNGTSGPYPDVYAKITSMNWWVYQNGTSGTITPSNFSGGGGPFYEVNFTNFAPPDSNGLRWSDWYAQWAISTFVTPSPALNGLYTDNIGWVPESGADGDWNRDGTTDSAASVSGWLGQGYQTFFGDLRKAKPGIILLGNLATWGDPNSPVLTAPWNQMLQGGPMEAIIGQSWSVESWAGWQATLAWYRKTMAATAAPQLVLFHQEDDPTNYQAMRYGLTTCLMDNGYYELVSTDYHTVYWYDEYNASLGQATSSLPTAAWQNGVWRRDFQYGIALVNPKGNGAQTVTLETSYRKIAGTQVPSINSGQAVTSISLQDRDGIILLRSTPIKVPNAPSGVKLQN